MNLSKNIKERKCVPKTVLFNVKKRNFWCRDLTLKVRFLHLLTKHNSLPRENWLLVQNLSNSVTLIWKLANPYFHTKQYCRSKTGWSKNTYFVVTLTLFTTFFEKIHCKILHRGFHESFKVRWACTRTSINWKFSFFPYFSITTITLNLDINSFHIQTYNSFLLGIPKKIKRIPKTNSKKIPKKFQKNPKMSQDFEKKNHAREFLNYLHRTQRPKTLSDLFSPVVCLSRV